MGLLDYVFPKRRNERNFPLSKSFLEREIEKLYSELPPYEMPSYCVPSDSYSLSGPNYRIFWKNIPRERLLYLETLLKEGGTPQIKFQERNIPPYVEIFLVMYRNKSSWDDITMGWEVEKLISLLRASFELNQ